MSVCSCRRLFCATIFTLALLANCHCNGGDPIVPRGALWHYHLTDQPAPAGWQSIDFDATTWPTANAGFGYGDGDDATDLSEMRGQIRRLQIRAEFDLQSADELSDLYLSINFDDAFIAYLNGVEVARSGVRSRNGIAEVSLHEAIGFEQFPLRSAIRLLVDGKNVIAIEGFNQSLQSSDFSLHPSLLVQPEEQRGLNLSSDAAHRELSELRHRIQDQSSYIHLGKLDLDSAMSELRNAIEGEISIFDFGELLERLIAQIGDSHARITLPIRDPDARYLPFTIADTRDGIAAIKIDRSACIDSDFPYLIEIDGVPVDSWMGKASELVADGSPQLKRNRSLARARRVDRIRKHFDIPASPTAVISLRSPGHSMTQQHVVQLSRSPSPFGRVPMARSHLREDSIGYLRLETMDNAMQNEVARKMIEFKRSNGLIIDVRDNGGGRYGLSRLLHGYFCDPEAKPYVANIAKYRKSKWFERDHLHYRPTFRADYQGWHQTEREAIELIRNQFDPEWSPPIDQFSQWHYMVLGKTSHVGQYHYKRPVVVLCNSGSFSATDGFLSCMSDRHGVLLMGQPSGGGSGATQRFVLPESNIRVSLASMASFRPNGKLYDGNGIDVDVRVKPTLSDFLGQSDSVKELAAKLIRFAND